MRLFSRRGRQDLAQELAAKRANRLEAEAIARNARVALGGIGPLRGDETVAARALASFGIAGLRPLVLGLLSDSVNARYRAAFALHHTLSEMRGVPSFEGLVDGDERVAVIALLGTEGTYPGPRTMRRVVVELVGYLGDPLAIQPLIALMDAQPDDREPAMVSLGRLGDAGFQALLRFLDDDDPGARASAIRSLGALGDARALPALIECLADEDPDVRINVASALGDIGDRRAVPALVEIAKTDPFFETDWASYGETHMSYDLAPDRNYRVRDAAAKAVRELGDVMD